MWCSFQPANVTDPDVVKLAAAAAHSYGRENSTRAQSCQLRGGNLQLTGEPTVTSACSQVGATL